MVFKKEGLNVGRSRTKNVVINLLFMLPCQTIIWVLEFCLRRKFASTLGMIYMGVESTFSNVLLFFSILNLGVIPAISISLYKPLADGDVEKLRSIVAFTKKVCLIIAGCFAVIGWVLSFNLQLIANNIYEIPRIRTIYLLFLANILLPCFFAHLRSVILYNQKKYIIVIIDFISISLGLIAKMFFLNYHSGLISFAFCAVTSTILEGLIIFFVAKRLYPFLSVKTKKPLSRQEIHLIFKNVGGGVFNQGFGLIVHATVNVYMSRFVGLAAMGVYAPYQHILTVVKNFNWHFCESIGPSVGDLATLGERKKLEARFYAVLLINNWIFGAVVCILATSVNGVIKLWLPTNRVFDKMTCYIILINFYLLAVRKIVLMFKENMGIYWDGKYVTLCEAVLNIILGYFLAGYGAIGVFGALTISILCTCFWREPWLLFRLGFKKSPISFFKKQLLYYVAAAGSCLINAYIFLGVTFVGWGQVLVVSVVSVFVHGLLLLIFFGRTQEFLFLKQLILRRFLLVLSCF
ncbi:MAG: hypothetical protein LBJ83_02860 [Oscillospiraceae bacterium]|jgi:O-antigen/teichoic acid export membrane protein|nr:hypothetical protein [Oscillospiraceae bacterium]